MSHEKKIKTAELLSATSPHIARLFESTEYPWEIIPKIKDFISELTESGLEGYSVLSPGVLVGEGVRISDTAVIEPPAVLGQNTEVRPGAYLRGCVIVGEGCVIGNSTEIKNSVVSDRAQIPHYNYVGDSVLGLHAHMGAGAVCSNLKLGGGGVTVTLDKKYETGLRKFGAVLGDDTDIGCGCVLNPGTVIGRGSAAYPLLSLRGVYPENSIIKDMKTVIKKEIGLCAE